MVFFTDGYPSNYHDATGPDVFIEGNYNFPQVGTQRANHKTVADATVQLASDLKNGANGARIYTVGIFEGADPGASYKTTKSGSSTVTWSTGKAAANGLLHFISNDYASNEATSWSALTESPNNVAGYKNNGYYFAASNASGLNAAFSNIGQQIGVATVEMNHQTIVQDVISPYFKLLGEVADIVAYAPKCTSVANGIYGFDLPNDNGTLALDANGVVSGGGENRLPASCVTYNATDKTIQISGFNFSEHFVGLEGSTPCGRKMVVKVSVESETGVWGQNLPTNTPLSVVYPNGDIETPYPFNIPTTNIIADVWTEVVTEAPINFDPMNIDSPEDLAWFISHVNGRAGYGVNGNAEPHPNASGRLTAYIDMSRHNWVPIGSHNEPYSGTFDGNGHVVTGLTNTASTFYRLVTNPDPENLKSRVEVYPGMFGAVTGTVHDVFVLSADFEAQKHADQHIHYGILADTLLGNGKIYNCEVAGSLRTDNEEPSNSTLILGGLVGLNQGEIHSSMSMADLEGYTIGGAVGEMNGNSVLHNSFTNVRFKQIAATGSSGGLVAINGGTVTNCYVRFEKASVGLTGYNFGQIVGNNNNTIERCYWIDESLTGGQIPAIAVVGGPNVVEGGTYNAPTAPYLYNYDAASDNVVGGNSLLDLLNRYKGNGSAWKRTSAGGYSDGAGDINDDYPVLCFDYPCLGSSDGIVLDFSRSLDEMLDRHNTGKLNEYTNLGDNYKKMQHESVFGGTVNLFDNHSTNRSTADNVVVYIDEDISLLQGDASAIDAYTCQTLKKFAGDERWHNISSSLSNSVIGFSYTNNGMVPHNFSPDPCGLLFSSIDDQALFPSDAHVSAIDFYAFYEPKYHWINFKRNSLSHWHMDNYDWKIEEYNNEETLTPGKGYLLAIDKDCYFQNRGMLNNKLVEMEVTADAPEWTGLKGYNLLGNPYQSYLDFDAFVEENTGLWSGEAYAQTYAVYDPGNGQYIQYAPGSSKEANVAGRYLNMHQGFFVRVSGKGTAKFTNAMRSNEGTPCFRGEGNHYPLVNFTVVDSEGNKDVAVLEVGRPENGGAEKLRVGSAKGRISLRHEGGDFAILFREMTEGSQPVYFDAEETGVYTLGWNVANADFRELTLVDNITGVRCDMLNRDSYTFEGRVSDYRSRFKVIIGEFAGQEGDDTVISDGSLAFYDGGEWVVNGEGTLVVVDMLGRTLYTAQLGGAQSRVGLNGLVPGVYVLRVSNGGGTVSQKIMVK